MNDPVVGLQLFTLRDYTQTLDDLARALPRVAQMGYEAIQISGIGPDIRMKDVASVARDNGLCVASTHTTLSRLQTEFDRVVAEYEMLDACHVAVGGLEDPHAYYSEEGLDRFLDEVRPISSKLADVGMDFSFHNHWTEMIRLSSGETWFEAALRKTDDNELKFEIDTYWIQAGGGDPAEYIRKCAGRIPLLHLKDMAVSMESEGQPFQIEVGSGSLNWPRILAEANDAGVEHLLVEQATFNGLDPFDSVRISHDNIRRLMAENAIEPSV